MKLLDLFSGIGGFSLGFERAGMETVAFCEVDDKCRKVLHKHWPEVKCYTDVKELTNEQLRTDGIVPEVICGGFPCQDISNAGPKSGIKGGRSSLWSEFARIIGDVRPKWAVIENVPPLRSRGLALVLQDLWAIGYDAEWHCVPASAIGTLHRRDRIWIIAYPSESRRQSLHNGNTESDTSSSCGSDVANPSSKGLQGSELLEACYGRFGERLKGSFRSIAKRRCSEGRTFWQTEPKVGRVVDGLPGRVDRIKQLGNSVCPQLTEAIGSVIMNMEKSNP